MTSPNLAFWKYKISSNHITEKKLKIKTVCGETGGWRGNNQDKLTDVKQYLNQDSDY